MATQWVRPTNGNDANDGLTFATAKQTINAACYNSTRGDIVFLVAEASITLVERFDLCPDNGSVLPGRLFVGVNSSGVEDGTKFVFDTGTMDPTQQTAAALVEMVRHIYYRRSNHDNDKNTWRNVHFHAGHKFLHCINASSIGLFINCRFSHAKGAAVNAATCSMDFCEIDNCQGSRALDQTRLRFCWVHHNTGLGLRPRDGSPVIGCVFSDNGGGGVDITGASVGIQIVGCVAHGNGGTGFTLRGSFANTSDAVMFSCSTNNGGRGFNNSDFSARSSVQNCIAGSGAMANTSGSSQKTTDYNLVTGEPVYRDPANGDFTITNLADFGAAFAPFGAFGETVTRIGGDWLRGYTAPGGSPITIAHFG